MQSETLCVWDGSFCVIKLKFLYAESEFSVRFKHLA